MARLKDSLYSDLNRYFAVSRDIRTKSIDVEAVENAIDTIITTSPKERIFNPEFGSNIQTLLFEPIDSITSSRILFELINAIERWDLRVTVNSATSDVTPDYDNNAYYVKLVYSIVGLEDEEFKFEKVISR